MTHTDIKSDNRLLRALPACWRPYLLLARLDRPIGTWLLLLPGWWSIMLAHHHAHNVSNPHIVWLVALFGIGAVAMRGAGCVINDLWDRDLDRQVARTRARPLAAGILSVRQALVFLLALLAIGAIILCQLPMVAILLGLLTLPLIALYPLAKRVTWWPQLLLGIIFNFGALMGWAAVRGTVGMPAILLYCGGIFWTLGYDTIYAQQDVEDDALAGIKSTARKFGQHSKKWVAGFFALTALFFISTFITAQVSIFSFAVLGLACIHLCWQLAYWHPGNPTSSLAIFRANRDFGLLMLLAAVI